MKAFTSLLAHPEVIKGTYNAILTNLTGVDQEQLDSPNDQVKKESTLYFNFLAMTSSVIIYLYENKFEADQ